MRKYTHQTIIGLSQITDEHADRLTFALSEDPEQKAVTFKHHTPNQFTTSHERIAFVEGYQAGESDEKAGYYKPTEALADDATSVEAHATPNPYTSADTMTAWRVGYDDWGYEAQPFDPTNPLLGIPNPLEAASRYAYNMNTFLSRVPRGYGQMQDALVFSFTGGSHIEADQRPVWEHNRIEDRCVPLHGYTINRVVQAAIAYHEDFGVRVELPCPDYEFSIDGNRMEIFKGAFYKEGSKQEWQAVIDTMQEKVNEIPDGVNVEDLYARFDATIELTVEVTVPVEAILPTEDGFWHGDESDLEYEIKHHLETSDSHSISQYIDEDDFRYAGWDLTEWGDDLRVE